MTSITWLDFVLNSLRPVQNHSNLAILKMRINPRKHIKGLENASPLGENCFLHTKRRLTDLWLIRLLCCWNTLSQADEWCQGRTPSPSNSSSLELLPLCLTLLHFPACQDATRMCLHSSFCLNFINTSLPLLFELWAGQGIGLQHIDSAKWSGSISDANVIFLLLLPFCFFFLLRFRCGIVSALSCVQ